jgi:hypothetical protein
MTDRPLLLGALIATALGLNACGGKQLLTITFPDKRGTAEYYICDRDARHCHPTKQGDVDDLDYAPGMDSLSPPAQCPHGAAKMELIISGDRVERINYECAAAPGVTTNKESDRQCGPSEVPAKDLSSAEDEPAAAEDSDEETTESDAETDDSPPEDESEQPDKKPTPNEPPAK